MISITFVNSLQIQSCTRKGLSSYDGLILMACNLVLGYFMLEVRKSLSLDIQSYLHFFVLLFYFILWHGPIEYVTFFKRSSWPLEETLISATTPSQSVHKNNVKEGVLHTPQISRTGISLNAVYCHTQNTPLFVGRGRTLTLYKG